LQTSPLRAGGGGVVYGVLCGFWKDGGGALYGALYVVFYGVLCGVLFFVFYVHHAVIALYTPAVYPTMSPALVIADIRLLAGTDHLLDFAYKVSY
jgi:hypothetical protein